MPKLKPESVKAYTAMGEFHYVGIACSSIEQAEDIRKQILEKVEVNGPIKTY